MIKPNIRFRYLSAGRVLLTHTRNLEVITLPRENHIDVICLPSHISHKMQPLDKAHMELLKTFYRQWIEKWLRSHPGRVVTVYQIDELFGNAYKRAATGEIAAKGFRATGLFPCDKNIFRPHDFPLAPEDTQADPVSHLALVKTSDQPSFSSANFSPFTSAQALRSSYIRALPSLNLKPNPRGGSAKKRTSSSNKQFVAATQKKNIKQATKSKSSRPASNALLGPSKRRKRRFCLDPALSDTPSDSDNDLAVPFAEDSTQEDEEQDAVRSVLLVSLKTTMEKTKNEVRNVSNGPQTLSWCGGKFCLWALSGINIVLFLFCILCICIFFLYFITIPCAFCEKYSPSQIRNICQPNLGRWSFYWN